MKNECQECGRVFDLADPTQANEWFYGHDCEEVDEPSIDQSWEYRRPVQFQGPRAQGPSR